jgi:hypothetical protein
VSPNSSPASRAIAFGCLAFVRGCSLLIAGATLGAAYSSSITLAITVVIAANIIGFVGRSSYSDVCRNTPGSIARYPVTGMGLPRSSRTRGKSSREILAVTASSLFSGLP